MDQRDAFSIRHAEPRDIPVLIDLILGLCRHHGDDSFASAESLTDALFGPERFVTGLLAETEDGPIAYALMFPVYRAHFGQKGMDLHHIFVDPNKRALGVGKAMMAKATAIARSWGCGYLTLIAADENLKAQEFYERLGLERVEGHHGVRFSLDLRAPT